MVHDMYLFEVKKPSESKQPWDYYKLLATLPGDQAFMPLSKSSCPLVKQAGQPGLTMHTQRPIPATIAAVIRDGRAAGAPNPPDQGRWAFPGGKIEMGERIEDARELFEETGVTAEPLTVFDAVDVFDHDADGLLRRHYILVAVLCRWISASRWPATTPAARCRWPSWTRRRWP